MPFYVLGSGGAKHGPVELATLNQWAAEGRILPQTLIEDVGSGVKSPARAIPGLVLPPAAPAGTSPTGPRTPLAPQSNYVRPGYGTGGSDENLFLPAADQASLQPANIRGQGLFLPKGATPHLQPSKSLFLPDVNANWAWHSAACVAGSIACGAIVGFTHWYFGKLLLFAFAFPIYGVERAIRGAEAKSALSTLLVVLNLLAFGCAALFVFKDAIF